MTNNINSYNLIINKMIPLKKVIMIVVKNI